MSIADGAPEHPVRDGLPLPGRTVPDVVSQLCYRVLGPYKNRARSVLHWAGLTGERPGLLRDTAAWCASNPGRFNEQVWGVSPEHHQRRALPARELVQAARRRYFASAVLRTSA